MGKNVWKSILCSVGIALLTYLSCHFEIQDQVHDELEPILDLAKEDEEEE